MDIGIAAALGTLASQVPHNWATACYSAAAGATILAVLLRDPGAPDNPQE